MPWTRRGHSGFWDMLCASRARQSQVLVPLAGLVEAKGDHRRAAELHEQSRQLAEDLGLWSDVADRLNDLTRLRAWQS